MPVNGFGNYTTSSSAPITAAGTYTWVATYSGDANYLSTTAPCGDPNETFTFGQAAPTLTTTASGTTVGQPISDSATLAGGSNPTGTIVFNAYGPNNANCSGAAFYSNTVAVNGNGTYNSGNSQNVSQPGTYRWTAAYSGDANNAPVTSPCNAANESTQVNEQLAVVYSASPSSGPPGGSYTFTIAITNNAGFALTINDLRDGALNDLSSKGNCGTAVGTTLAPNASYQCTYIETVNGTAGSTHTRLVLVTANDAALNDYGGDDDATITFVVTPQITTSATPSAAVGTAISDTATLSNGASPTGTITFTLFGPDNATCSGAPVFTSTVPVNGNGTYQSGNFVPTTPGAYRWVGAYSGDAGNNAVSTACNDANETTIVTQAQPTITTSATANATLTQPISDTATLAGGASPTGTITFTLFGPNNPVCTGAPIFTSTVPVNGNGNYTSGNFTPTTAGSYNWVAIYSGDANNNGATSPCGATGETSTVSALPTITVDKTATPTTRPEPGGSFTFSLVVTNTSTQNLTINTLTDNIYGNVTTLPGSTCNTAPGTTLAPNGTYSCAFTGSFTGNAGASQTDIVTVQATNPNGVTASDTDDATVTITAVAPTATVTKTASPLARPAPGGNFTFTVVVTNTSFEAVTITSLTDDVYGNLNGQGTCANGAVLQPNQSYTCAFTGAFTGNAGATQTDTVTATVVDDDGQTATAADDAVVRIYGLTTTATGTANVGQSISDTATITNAANPTGTLTFSLFGPNDATCATPPVFTSNVAVSGNGNYTSGSFTPTLTGTYRWRAAYSGDSNNIAGSGACNDAGETSTVTPAPAAMSTSATQSVTIGNSIADVATLTNGVSPTGTITFNLFGPNNATCAGAAVFTNTKTVTGNGSYTSDSFTPTAPGTYRWIASYSGDANNAAFIGACNDAGETSTVTQASPTINTSATATAAIGQPISDVATVAGGFNPTGTITFSVYGPDNATCAGTAAFTSTVAVNGNGNYASGAYTTTALGAYRWIAAYSGDANNAATSGACNAPGETTTVTKASPTMTTDAQDATYTEPIVDEATLAGGFNPTGTITFNVYGPNNANCAGTPTHTSNATVNGNDTYSSAEFTPAQFGTYRWIASYSGDANNNAVTGVCNDPAEVSEYSKAPADVDTRATLDGNRTFDTATLEDGVNPTGTITFELFGPDDGACLRAPVHTSTVNVNGNGNYTSSTYTATQPGRYRWVATYSGDAFNEESDNACGDPRETVNVTSVPTTTTTTTTTTTPTPTSAPPGSAPTTSTTVPGGGTSTTGTDLIDTQPIVARLTVTPMVVVRGGQVTVIGTGYPAGRVDLTMFSDPVALGSVTANAAGSFQMTVTIPANTAAGVHRLVAVSAVNGASAERSITVTLIGVLQRTGSNALQLVATGLLLLAVGLTLRRVVGVGATR